MDSAAKVAEIEQAEKEKMKEKVESILKHGINCFINRYVLSWKKGRVTKLYMWHCFPQKQKFTPSRHGASYNSPYKFVLNICKNH